ncbi:MAG: DNA primase, partial [Coriobacteriales bacterium]
MGRIEDDDIRRVREATDLVQLVAETVVLKQKGRLFWGCCPFHNEKTPSFKIDPGTQLWHCFGCGKGGDVFGYVMEREKLEFPEAVRQLADRAHIEIKESQGGMPRGQRQRIMDACEAAEEFFHIQLMRSKDSGAASARSYLGTRGFGSGPSRDWRLGFAPGHGRLCAHLQSKGFSRDELVQANLAFVNDGGRMVDRFYNRVMFPVHDLQGRTIAFGGRVIGSGEPKYLNSSETPVFHKSSNMFGIHKAKSAIVSSGTAIVVEGYTDVIALHEAGIRNAVATLGTALTAQHVKLLGRFASSIVYLFDGDAAGQKAAMRAAEFIDWSSALESGRNPIELKVTVLPEGMDPAEFVAARGAEALQEQVA